MKNPFYFLLALALLSAFPAIAQNVGIGTSIPDASAMLEVQSTTQGMLVPRMTSAQRLAISNVANGLLVYDITTNSFWFFDNSEWQELVGGAVKGDALSDGDADTGIQVDEGGLDDDHIRFDVDGVEAMVLKADGNLQIKGQNPDDAGFMELLNGDEAQFMRLFGGRSGDPAPFVGWPLGSPLRFVTSNSDYSGFTERMRIDGVGNVGIGTTAPTQKLDVNGRIVAKGYKNTIYEAGGLNANSVTLLGTASWTDVPDLSVTFSLDEATTVMTSYTLSNQATLGSLMTRIMIDGTEVNRMILGPVFLPGSTRWFHGGSTGHYVSELSSGSHTIKIQFKCVVGVDIINDPVGTDYQNRFLQVLVFGSN